MCDFSCTLSTGIWFTLHWTKVQAVCKPCTVKSQDGFCYSIKLYNVYDWLIIYELQIHSVAYCIYSEKLAFAPVIWMLGCAETIGILWRTMDSLQLSTKHQLLADVWVAIVVCQSRLMVLVALVTLPLAHLYQVCEKCFWEALSISCEYWQLDEK